MDDDQQFCLRWNNHQSTIISVCGTLLENDTLVDCTLFAEGQTLRAHKVILSACSPLFADLLSKQYDKHPIFILNVKFQELRAMMDYMYRGEVNISQDQLAALLKAAESLQIKGLSDNRGGGGGASAQKGDNVAAQKQQTSVPVVSKSGLTIEQHKRHPKKHPAAAAANESDISMSREGSTSPTSRNRKRFRRRSVETNNMDNHDQHSNSSSQSAQHHTQQQQLQQPPHMTSILNTQAALPLPQITAATSAANVLNVTKKTDIHEPKKEMDQSMQQQTAHHDNDDDDDDEDDHNDMEPPAQRPKHDMDHMKDNKMDSTHSELLIEPKSEYDDGQDETVEDLTLDDEELLEDLDQAGPSHGGEGSSQGYAQWQVDRTQDEVFLAAQEAAGQHRDAQVIDDNIKSTEVMQTLHISPVPTEEETSSAYLELASPKVKSLPIPEPTTVIRLQQVYTSSAANNATKTENYFIFENSSNNDDINLFDKAPMVDKKGKERFFCPLCNVKYTKLKYLKSHMKICGQSFQCEFCSLIYKQKRTYVAHVKSKHGTEVKPSRRSASPPPEEFANFLHDETEDDCSSQMEE